MNQIDQMNQLMIEDDEGFQPGYLLKNFKVAVTGNQCGVMVEALLCDQRVGEPRLCSSSQPARSQ
jgi:hypothetical protein